MLAKIAPAPETALPIVMMSASAKERMSENGGFLPAGFAWLGWLVAPTSFTVLA